MALIKPNITLNHEESNPLRHQHCTEKQKKQMWTRVCDDSQVQHHSNSQLIIYSFISGIPLGKAFGNKRLISKPCALQAEHSYLISQSWGVMRFLRSEARQDSHGAQPCWDELRERWKIKQQRTVFCSTGVAQFFVQLVLPKRFRVPLWERPIDRAEPLVTRPGGPNRGLKRFCGVCYNPASRLPRLRLDAQKGIDIFQTAINSDLKLIGSAFQ